MPSFDIVSSINMQEVLNAVDQVRREIGTRYDFKDSLSTIELKESIITLHTDQQIRLNAMQEMLKQKLAKRGVSLKACEFKEPQKAGGDTLRQEVAIKEGLSDDDLKKLNKLIKDRKFNKISSQIQGNQLRIMGPKKDMLQEVIQHLRSAVQFADLQFVNFRD